MSGKRMVCAVRRRGENMGLRFTCIVMDETGGREDRREVGAVKTAIDALNVPADMDLGEVLDPGEIVVVEIPSAHL